MNRAGVLVSQMLAGLLPLLAQHGSTPASNPYNDPEDRAAGAQIFRARCTECHGKDGSGATGPDLTTGVFRRGAGDASLFQTISKGIPGSAMPAFALNGREVWQVVSYVRSLSEGAAAGKAKGDPSRGASVYAAAGCSRCHSINGEGGQVGPDLSLVGARRSLGHLESAVLRPDEEVAPSYWSVRARTKAGRIVSGIRLNEDTFSFQILDERGRLASLLKEDLAASEVVRTSPMPSVVGKLNGTEFDDLIAWLASLRGRKGETR